MSPFGAVQQPHIQQLKRAAGLVRDKKYSDAYRDFNQVATQPPPTATAA